MPSGAIAAGAAAQGQPSARERVLGTSRPRRHRDDFRRAARRDGYPAHDEPPTHQAEGVRLPSERVHTSSARWVCRPGSRVDTAFWLTLFSQWRGGQPHQLLGPAAREAEQFYYNFNLLLELWPSPLLAAPNPHVLPLLPPLKRTCTSCICDFRMSCWSPRVASMIQHARPIQLSTAGR
eukprot:5965719-Prymnesium_polylepis.1